MITPIRVPKLGMTQGSITVVKWLKADGAAVKQGEIVVVIETAKVSFEVEAPASGHVFSMRSVNQRVKIGEMLGVVAESLGEFESYKRDLPKMREAEAQLLAGEAEEEEGVRISFEEEEERAKVKEERRVPVLPPLGVGDRKVSNRTPFSGMRRRVADNLVASLQYGAQLTLVSETDMTEFARFREELILDYPDTKITFVEMIVKILPERLLPGVEIPAAVLALDDRIAGRIALRLMQLVVGCIDRAKVVHLVLQLVEDLGPLFSEIGVVPHDDQRFPLSVLEIARILGIDGHLLHGRLRRPNGQDN